MLSTAQKYLKQTKLWGTTTKNQNNKKIKQNLNDTKAQMAGCQLTSTITMEEYSNSVKFKIVQ